MLSKHSVLSDIEDSHGPSDSEFIHNEDGNPALATSNKLCRLFKDGGGDFRYSDTTHLSRNVKVLKLKNLKKDATLKLFKDGMSMSVQKSQVHKLAKLQDGVEIVLG
ncbi:hypothetical protein Tco_0044414 [Tanacetum coccineum]